MDGAGVLVEAIHAVISNPAELTVRARRSARKGAPLTSARVDRAGADVGNGRGPRGRHRLRGQGRGGGAGGRSSRAHGQPGCAALRAHVPRRVRAVLPAARRPPPPDAPRAGWSSTARRLRGRWASGAVWCGSSRPSTTTTTTSRCSRWPLGCWRTLVSAHGCRCCAERSRGAARPARVPENLRAMMNELGAEDLVRGAAPRSCLSLCVLLAGSRSSSGPPSRSPTTRASTTRPCASWT
jgi:hypothetical protein